MIDPRSLISEDPQPFLHREKEIPKDEAYDILRDWIYDEDHWYSWWRAEPEPIPWVGTTRVAGLDKPLRGTLPRRLARYLELTKQDVSPSTVAKVGEALQRRMAIVSKDTLYRITNEFSWRAGQFGDARSCFWKSNRLARGLLQEAGALAFLIYSANKGVARAWMAPTNSGWVLFNGYGYQTERLAATAAKVIQAKPVLVRLTNHGKSNGMVYINGEQGYWFGEAEQPPWRIDLQIGPEEFHCDICGEVTAERHDDHSYGPNNELICDTCVPLGSCDSCGERTPVKDMAPVVRDFGARDLWCPACLRKATHCEDCGMFWYNIYHECPERRE